MLYNKFVDFCTLSTTIFKLVFTFFKNIRLRSNLHDNTNAKSSLTPSYLSTSLCQSSCHWREGSFSLLGQTGSPDGIVEFHDSGLKTFFSNFKGWKSLIANYFWQFECSGRTAFCKLVVIRAIAENDVSRSLLICQLKCPILNAASTFSRDLSKIVGD